MNKIKISKRKFENPTEEEEVGLILVSQKTWDKLKTQFPPPIKSIFPTMGFMNSIPVRISELVSDNEIIQIPKKVIDVCRETKFHKPELKVCIPTYLGYIY
jgi:hypothetical protein